MGKKLLKPTRTRLEDVVKKDGRYSIEAYRFIYEALDHTVKLYGKKPRSEREEERHVTGRQLLDGFRRLALEQFGFMAWTVLDQWGIRETAAVGEIVFNLVEHGLMGKTDSDSKDDFKNVYDFKAAFDDGFRLGGNVHGPQDVNLPPRRPSA
ncbi:MAG: hypothetical protein FJ279_36600 [Planctomycetes bacterium]|nr:hypothetical protein [Planctomycetota bacterium]MBM4079139.1 hypothetical protein [Planctomycetota bacterium]MBM4083589.1 hypothetical protein [Planctomycetota bacterium]